MPPPSKPEPQPVALPSFSRLTGSQPDIEKKILKPYKCMLPGCNATFGQKGSLTRHVKSRHEKLRPHKCEQCRKSFSALWTLRVHQRNVHLKAKPHKCHLCDKSFGELFNKSKHVAIVHEGKRPFSCPICSRAFGYKGDMRKHVLELHEQTGRPYQCKIPTCGVKFARKRYLKRHENLSHKGNPLLASRDSPTLSTISRTSSLTSQQKNRRTTASQRQLDSNAVHAGPSWHAKQRTASHGYFPIPFQHAQHHSHSQSQPRPHRQSHHRQNHQLPHQGSTQREEGLQSNRFYRAPSAPDVGLSSLNISNGFQQMRSNSAGAMESNMQYTFR